MRHPSHHTFVKFKTKGELIVCFSRDVSLGRPCFNQLPRKNEDRQRFKFTAEISENQITFLYSTVLKEKDLQKVPSWTYQNPLQADRDLSIYVPAVKYGFIKGKVIRLLRTNSSKETLEEGLLKFKQRHRARGYLENNIERSLSGVKFAYRQLALTHIQKRKIP